MRLMTVIEADICPILTGFLLMSNKSMRRGMKNVLGRMSILVLTNTFSEAKTLALGADDFHCCYRIQRFWDRLIDFVSDSGETRNMHIVPSIVMLNEKGDNEKARWVFEER